MCGEEENPCSGGAGNESLPSANNLPLRMLMCGEEENPCSGGAGNESLPSANNFAWNK